MFPVPMMLMLLMISACFPDGAQRKVDISTVEAFG
jgi:hypothetical protein